MTTKLTDIGDMVRVETVASFGGKAPRTFGAVLVPRGDIQAIRLEIVRQAELIRVRKGVRVNPKEPVV